MYSKMAVRVGVRDYSCHKPANVTESGPGGVIQKKNRKISNGQRVFPDGLVALQRWKTALVKGRIAMRVARLPLDSRWPLPQRTELIVSMNSVSGSGPPDPHAISGTGP